MHTLVPIVAAIAVASHRQDHTPGRVSPAPELQSRGAAIAREFASQRFCRRDAGRAFMVPDVAWYDSEAIGWPGSNPVVISGEVTPIGHGLWEQVFIDGLDNFLR